MKIYKLEGAETTFRLSRLSKLREQKLRSSLHHLTEAKGQFSQEMFCKEFELDASIIVYLWSK